MRTTVAWPGRCAHTPGQSSALGPVTPPSGPGAVPWRRTQPPTPARTAALATIDEPAPQTELARGALTLFDTLSSTLANLAPVEGIFLAITLVVFAMGSMAPWAFLIAGIAILATGNTMSEFSRSIPSAG